MAPIAQQPTAPTFRTGTTLVEFTIVALDDDGNPVTDLKPEDVVLRERGRPRDIAFFRFDGVPTAAAETPHRPPAGFTTNRPASIVDPRPNVTAIVLDLINTASANQMSVREQALRHLQRLPANTYAALFRFSEDEPMTTLQTLTDQVELLRAQVQSLKPVSRRELATESIRGRPMLGGDCDAKSGGILSAALGQISTDATGSAGEAAKIAEQRALSAANEQIRSARLAKTLASLEALGNHLSAIPGRKSVIWITGGMPIILSPLPDRQYFTSYEPQIRQAAQRLANKGIAVYPVDAKGMCRANDKSNDQGLDGSNDAPNRVFGSLEVVAQVTGGRFIKYNDDPTAGITLAASDHRGTYTIGFYADDAADDHWRSLDVAVKRRGVTVRHRQGYLSAVRAAPQSWPAERWQVVGRERLDSSAIRLDARADAAAGQLVASIRIAAADLYFHEREGQTVAALEIGLVEIGRNGPTNVRQQPIEITLRNPLKDQRTQVIPLKTTWPLNDETMSVRLIVRDRVTGRYGSLNLAVRR